MATFASVARDIDALGRDLLTALKRSMYVVQREAMKEAPVGKVRGGTLRRSHFARLNPDGKSATVGANTPYARRVHQGSGKITVYPKRKKALFWKGARHPVKKVVQKPRKGNPWLRRAAERAQPAVERELAAWGTVKLRAIR